MRLVYTVALPVPKGQKEVRGFRTLSLSGVSPGKESTKSAEIMAARLTMTLWGDGCEIKLTDVEIDVEECRK